MATVSASLKSTGRTQGRNPLFGSDPESEEQDWCRFSTEEDLNSVSRDWLFSDRQQAIQYLRGRRIITSKLEHLSGPVSLSERAYFSLYTDQCTLTQGYIRLFTGFMTERSLLLNPGTLLLLILQKEGEKYEKPKPVKYIWLHKK